MADPSTLQPWWALAGVAVGFFLGEGSRYLRYRWDIWRNRRLVKEELRSVLSQLPLNADILRQAIRKLNEKQILSTRSVHLIITGYSSVLPDLYPHLSLIERNCLHAIYERLRVANAVMDEFEGDFIRALREKVVSDPWAAYAGRLEDVLHSFEDVEELSKSYLAGSPIDVFGKWKG